MTAALGRKQSLADPAVWTATRARSRQEWPDDRLDALIAETVGRIERVRRDRPRMAYGWSGGKDSVALAHVMALAGVKDCVLAISRLEFPAMLRWVTANMPPNLTVLDTGQDLEWLKANPAMLFPQGRFGSRWFAIVNHKGQERYFRDQKLDVIALGRRSADGNYCGPGALYTNKRKVTRFSPIADWPHEAVFSLIERERLPLPPCYDWPRGYQVGTGSWPARQWTTSTEHGFEEVWAIDPTVIQKAAEGGLAQAVGWLQRTGRA